MVCIGAENSLCEFNQWMWTSSVCHVRLIHQPFIKQFEKYYTQWFKESFHRVVLADMLGQERGAYRQLQVSYMKEDFVRIRRLALKHTWVLNFRFVMWSSIEIWSFTWCHYDVIGLAHAVMNAKMYLSSWVFHEKEV